MAMGPQMQLATVTDKLYLQFYLTLINVNINGHMWLGATVLDSTDLTDLRPRYACFLPKPVPGERIHILPVFTISLIKRTFFCFHLEISLILVILILKS